MREYPASPMQIAVYTADAFAHATPGAMPEHTQVSISFGETVNIPLLHQAWTWISCYHNLLFSSFKRSTSTSPITLREHTDCETLWHSLDWKKLSSEEIATKWNALQSEVGIKPLSLCKPPLHHFYIIELPEGIHHFLWTFHSILLDEESVYIILRDWLKIYGLLSQRQSLPPPQGRALSYAAVIGSIEETDLEITKKYWKDAFQNFSAWAPLHPLYSHKALSSSHILPRTYTEFFDQETSARLLKLVPEGENGSSDNSASLLTLLTGAWGLVLARSSVEGDTVFGVYRSCRSLGGPEAADTVGLFESLLPMRIKVPEKLTCGAWLQQLQKEEVALAPFILTNEEEVWAHANVAGYASPRFDSTLHYLPSTLNDRISREMPEWMRIDVRLQKISSIPVRIIARGEKRLILTLEYNPHQIAPALARRLFDRLLLALHTFEKNPHLTLSKISLLLPHEIESFFDTKNSTPEKASLSFLSSHLFASLETYAKQYAELPAVEKEGHSLSFSLIETYSQQLAAFLKRHSQQPETVILLAASPSPQMCVGLLGILKAGCICLPLDLSTCPTNLEKFFGHYKVSAVLTDNPDALGKIRLPTFVLDEIWPEITALPLSSPASPSPHPSAPALLLLQSNGERLLVSYETLQIALENAIRTYCIKPGDRILCHSLQGSAASIEECFIPLLTGATLVIAEKNIKTTRTAFQEAIESGRITHLRTTSAFWSQWVHYLKELGHTIPRQLRRILIESGHISTPIVTSWKDLNTQKSTECVTFYSPSGFIGLGITTEAMPAPELLEEGLICGQPQMGMVVFLTDNHRRLIPPLFPGTLVLLSETQQRKHLQGRNITTLPADLPMKKGELARWNEKGQLILLSQPHHSLSSEEFTYIELRRIEKILASHPDLIDAIVVQQQLPLTAENSAPLSRKNNLCAWIVPRDSHSLFPTTLENYLKNHLPKDRIPTQFALVTRFNLDVFDHIDIKSLPNPSPIPPQKPQIPLSIPTANIAATAITRTSSNTLDIIPITTLHMGNKDTALYFIHAGRGLVEDYRPIAHALSEKYAVHCLTIPRKRSTHPTTIEEIISQLLPSLRLHVSGKFAIVGIGTGAVFAWELARQLDQKDERNVPFILFEIPPTGHQKEVFPWLNKIKKTFFKNGMLASDPPQGHFAELIAAYQPPILQHKPYFFVSKKPDPEWRRRAPLGVWGQLNLATTSSSGNGSLLDKPEEIVSAVKGVFSSLNWENTPQNQR